MTERPESLGLKVLFKGSNPNIESVLESKVKELVGIDDSLF